MDQVLHQPTDPITISTIRAASSAGLEVENVAGATVVTFGPGSTQAAAFADGISCAMVASTSASGITQVQAATQDGIKLLGRAGGTGSYMLTLTPLTLGASRMWSFPDRDDTAAGLGAQTFTGAQRIDSTLSFNSAPIAVTGTVTPALQLLDTALNGSSLTAGRFGANASGPAFYFYKSRGATIGSHGAVQAGDALGIFRATGDDGSAGFGAATFQFLCDINSTTGIVPGRVVITTNDSAGTSKVALNIDSNQVVFCGELGSTTSSISAFSGGTIRPRLQALGQTQEGFAAFGQARFDATPGDCPHHILAHSKGTSFTSFTAVVANDTMGIWAAEGSDGTDFSRAGSMRILCDGTVAENQVPGRIEFYTANSSGTETLTLTLSSAQVATFAGQVIASAGIDVADAQYIYLRGDASTDGGVRISSQASGTMIIEARAGGSWATIGSFA